jgi:L,D-transpeptidase catalytic domain
MMRAGWFARSAFVVALAATAALPSRANAQDRESGADGDSWNSAPAPHGRLSMVVDLRSQWAFVYRGGVRIAATPISSGKRGYQTPTGTFAVVQKQKTHRSNEYHNARMPFMQRLSWSGLALHAGRVPGHPSSHGCVRLPLSFAKWLYKQSTMGMRVVITDQSPSANAVRVSSNTDAFPGVGGHETDSWK